MRLCEDYSEYCTDEERIRAGLDAVTKFFLRVLLCRYMAV